MHVTDPSAILGSLLLLTGVIFTALSGRRERDRQRDYEEKKKAVELARQDAKEEADQEKADEDKTYARLQADYLRVTGACDRCERRLQACQEALDGRDAYWEQHRTNYPEVAGLIAVPGALTILRKYRDRRADGLTGNGPPDARGLLVTDGNGYDNGNGYDDAERRGEQP